MVIPLAGKVPDGLLDKLNEYIKAVNTEDGITNYTFTIAHDPNSKWTQVQW